VRDPCRAAATATINRALASLRELARALPIRVGMVSAHAGMAFRTIDIAPRFVRNFSARPTGESPLRAGSTTQARQAKPSVRWSATALPLSATRT
jgi:hypothetical protein